MKKLRDDQARALEDLRCAVANGQRRICMQAATGWGKTVLAAAIVENALSKNKKVLFTVPALSLIDQTVEMFWSQGIGDVGVIQADHHLTDWSKPVQVASVQTLLKRDLPQADVVMIDEVHRWFTAYPKWLDPLVTPIWAKAPMIGLSATPWTRGMKDYFDVYIRVTSTEELIAAGLLSPFKVFAPSHPDLSQVQTVAGDYHEGQLSKKMSEEPLVADAVDTWQRLGENRSTLCYAVDRAHAKHLQQKFEAAGVRCGYQDAETDNADKISRKTGLRVEGRDTIKRKFHDGEYRVVVNVGTLTTGVDWDVRCISMCRPTKSDMLFVQIVGRGLRTAEGKDHCLILDHSDNHLRLGFVTDVDTSYTGLLAGKAKQHANRTEGIRLPKECPQCAYLKPPKMAQCPSCGFVAVAQNGVRVEAGELRELNRKPRPKGGLTILPQTTEEKRTFYTELMGAAIRHGYKPTWADNQYKHRMGTFPPFAWRELIPIMPGPATAGWIKSRQIAYAQGMAKRDRAALGLGGGR